MASVLIIDDHQGTLDTFSAILRMAGFETATAATGRAGIELALARSFDVILVDLRLPDVSGLDVVRELRRCGIAARVVVVTAFPTFESSFDAAAAGADGYADGPSGTPRSSTWSPKRSTVSHRYDIPHRVQPHARSREAGNGCRIGAFGKSSG